MKHKLSLNELQSTSPIKKKKLRSAASSSAELQRRRRAEIETLRKEVAQLEECLSNEAKGQQLSLVVTKDNGQLSEWHRHALIQYQQRLKSEQRNHQLKKMIEQQSKDTNKLRHVLYKRNVLDGIEFVRTFESPCVKDFFMDYASLLMDQLEEEVDSTYRNFKRMYQPQDGSIITCSQTMYDEKCQSNTLEFETTTPMDWPMRAAFKHVWNVLESSSDQSRKSNALETKVHLTLPLPNRAACHFHKLHFLRKFEEQDRVIIIWSDLMQMTSKNIRLRSIAHAVFTPSEINPLHACVMQTFLKLYVEPSNGGNVLPEDVQYGREVVLGAFGRLMRIFWQTQQSQLLEKPL
ncbi:Hypothetical protein PHPALM_6104 [Phytophthora palmivora]|uniref:M96 mating-specific protein family n=1 Tax=Phytophthora palmivora TaxID=4796 RepID=A0A2P4YFR4_9STRA|nr:Hypothetical protein PHPALM_6104 [Phytophthora palmivora]